MKRLDSNNYTKIREFLDETKCIQVKEDDINHLSWYPLHRKFKFFTISNEYWFDPDLKVIYIVSKARTVFKLLMRLYLPLFYLIGLFSKDIMRTVFNVSSKEYCTVDLYPHSSRDEMGLQRLYKRLGLVEYCI